MFQNNNVKFTNWEINKNSDTIEIKENDVVIKTIDQDGIVFNPSGSSLISTRMEQAIQENSYLGDSLAQYSGGGFFRSMMKWSNDENDTAPGNQYMKIVGNKLYIDNESRIGNINTRTLIGFLKGDLNVYLQDQNENLRFKLFTANGIDQTNEGYSIIENLAIHAFIGLNLKNGENTILYVEKVLGSSLKEKQIPLKPTSSGNYKLRYNSSNQSFEWTTI